MRKWKRSDISQEQVLRAFALPYLAGANRRDEVLMRETGAPEKVVWAAMVREEDRGLIDCGVNLRGGWLTEEGRRRLAEITSDLVAG